MKQSTTILFLLFSLGAVLCTQAQSSDSVTLSINKDDLIFPGNAISFGVAFTAKNGDVSQTRGLLNGKIPWRKLYVESSIDPRVRNGVLHIPHDLSMINQKEFTIRIYDRKKKHLYYHGTIPYHYPTAIQPHLPSDFTKAPGFRTPFWLSLQWNNGVTTQVHDKKGGMISLADFNYKVEGGEINRNHLYIWSDVYAFSNHTVALYAYARDFTIPESEAVSFVLDYKASYTFSASAWNGSSGQNGFSGSNGSSGCHGTDGQWGTPGNHGDHGHDIKVTADAYFDEILQTTLVDVQVTDLETNSRTLYRVHSQQGTVVVRSSGGDGGSGGRGGNGGDGGAGADGRVERVKKKINDSTYVEEVIQHPGFPGGNGGDGGNGAPGGHGGDGGTIYVYYTKAAEPYLSVIKAHSTGGSGGWGGMGGSAGSGGNGGSGEPGGRSGCSGRSGMSGPNGSSGRRGQVVYYPVKD